MLRNSLPEVFSEGRKQEQRSRTFFLGIDIINSSPSPTEYWVTLCLPELIFFTKVALVKDFFCRLVATIAGLNPAEGMDVNLFCLYVVLCRVGRGMCDGLITRPEESCRVSNCV
jgi:hypothetical protein